MLRRAVFATIKLMFFGRSHLIVLILIMAPIAVGVFLGTRVAADGVNFSQPVSGPTTTDPRHPVEIYFGSMFVRTMPAALARLGISTVREDRVSLVPPVEYGLGGQLVITRALPVVMRDGGQSRTVFSWAETVGGLLAEQQIELGDSDRLEPQLETPLIRDQTVTITRVAVSEVAKTETVAPSSKTQDDPTQPRGTRHTTQRGQNGIRRLIYQVTREDGREVSRKLIHSEVTQSPVDEIIAVGTRVVVLGQGRATWYDPPWSGLTAAHNTLPKGTFVDVVNVATGKRVTVKINDRGIQSDAVIDLSPEAFRVLAPLASGVISVRLEVAG